MIKLKPTPGLRIIDPKNMRPIPDEGIEIQELTTYWARRINCGDVILIEDLELNQAGGAEK